MTLETLGDSLPAGTISDNSTIQTLPDAMDIKLKRDVTPHITAYTSFKELVEIAEKRDAMTHSTALSGTRNQYTNAVSNAVTQPRCKEPRYNNQVHHPRSSNNTSQYNKVPPHEQGRRKREGAYYYSEKIVHSSKIVTKNKEPKIITRGRTSEEMEKQEELGEEENIPVPTIPGKKPAISLKSPTPPTM